MGNEITVANAQYAERQLRNCSTMRDSTISCPTLAHLRVNCIIDVGHHSQIKNRMTPATQRTTWATSIVTRQDACPPSDEEAHSGPTFQHARNNIAQSDERVTGFDDAYAVTMLRRIFSEMQKAWRMQKRKSSCAGNDLAQRCDNQSASQVCQIYLWPIRDF